MTPQAVRETGDGAEEANGPVPMGGQPASEAPAPPSVPREELEGGHQWKRRQRKQEAGHRESEDGVLRSGRQTDAGRSRKQGNARQRVEEMDAAQGSAGRVRKGAERGN